MDDKEKAAPAPAARQLTATDLLLLAGFALLGFFVLDDFMAPPSARSQMPAETEPKREQVCSEEELRQMPAGLDICFDDVSPDALEGEGADPTLGAYQSS